MKTMLGHVMDGSTAVQFSIDGHKGKQSFKDLQLVKVLLGQIVMRL